MNHSLLDYNTEEANCYKLALDDSGQKRINAYQLFNGARTVQFIFQPKQTQNTSTGTKQVFGSDVGTTNNATFLFKTGGTGGLNWIRKIGSTNQTIQSDIKEWNAGEKYFISLNIHPIDGMCMYVNGVKQTETNPTTDPIGNSTANTFFNGRSGTSFFMDWDIDEVKFWSTCRSQTEVISDMIGKPTNSETDLIDYFSFKEGTGVSTLGVKGGLLTYVNSPLWETTPCLGYNKICFNSINQDYYSLGSGLPTSSIKTILYKYTPTIDINGSTPQQAILSEYTANSSIGRSFLLRLISGQISFIKHTSYSATSVITSTGLTFNKDQEYYIAVTIGAGGTKMYVDNTLVASDTNTNALLNTNAEMGNFFRGSSNQLAGLVDGNVSRIVFFSEELNLATITSYENKIFEGTELGLIAFYSLLQGEGEKIPEFKNAYTSGALNTGSTDPDYFNNMWKLTA